MKMYCSKSLKGDDGIIYYNHIYPSIGQVRMCIKSTDPVYEVEVREAKSTEDTPYWGWMNNNKEISMIYPRLFLLSMCFSHGVEAEEKVRHGRKIKVAIGEIKCVKKT